MIDLYTYIFEKCFSSKDLDKHNYLENVISAIINGKTIRIGEKGENSFSIDPDILPIIKDKFSKIKQSEITKDKFNSIMSSYGLPKWTQIYKGDFSGYKNGLASKNKGNEFENDFVQNFDNYKDDLIKYLKLDNSSFDDCTPESICTKNYARPIIKGNKGIILGGSHTISDVRIKDITGNTYNLSLKYGNTVTFCNSGVSKIFSKHSFDKYEKTHEYEAEIANGVNGQELLDLFCIDKNKFAEVFAEYGSKKDKDYVDITKQLNNNEPFEEFLESVIGYGYILVHKMSNNKIYYKDLRTKKDMLDFIGNKINHAEIQYGGKNGNGKRVDIIVDLKNLHIKFNIRNKQGGILPTHIMADYTINNDN